MSNIKNITLVSMKMTNFKGGNGTTHFNANVTTIAGRNGVGKSRHKDAFMWCLFGKDSEDRQDYKIITHDQNGNPLSKVDASVEIELFIDGRIKTLTRTYSQKWVVSKGTTEEHLEGHTTKFFVDEVPVSATEYKNIVRTIIDEDIFKSITNPHYFICQRDWKDQRNELFRMVGSITDYDIAKTSVDLLELWERMDGRTFDQYKELITRRKKDAKRTIDENGIRIDQMFRMMPEAIDVDEVEGNLAEIQKQISSVDAAMADRNSLCDANNAEYERLCNLKNELIDKLTTLVADARRRSKEEAEKNNYQYNSFVAAVRDIENDIRRRQEAIRSTNDEITSLVSSLERKKANLEEIRNKYDAVEAEEYTGSDVCQFCGQRLPELNIEQNIAKFNREKSRRLERIKVEGVEAGKFVESAEANIKNLEELVSKYKEELNELETRKRLATEKLASVGKVEPTPVVPSEVAGYEETKLQIDAINEKLASGKSVVDLSDLKEQKSLLISKRDECLTLLNNDKTRKKSLEEVESIKESSRVSAQVVADCQREEDLMIAFYRVKISECEHKINALFKNVRFKLSRVNLKGNEEECCEAYVNGIPYGTVNSAAQINAGLDIINAYCRFHEISAPIFIDWAESINVIDETFGQQIRLRVSDDEVLTIY